MSRFPKGLNKDVDPSAQPEGTYRHLENGVMNDVTGAITTEQSRRLLQAGFDNVIGTLTVPQRDSIFLFGTDSGSSYIDQENYSSAATTTILEDSGISTGSLRFDLADFVDVEYSFF
mgnify:CR=1 FL=1